MLKKVNRSVSVVYNNHNKDFGFFEVFLLADTAFIYSLEGSGVLAHLDKSRIEEVAQCLQVDRLVFIMKPKVFKIMQGLSLDFNILREVEKGGDKFLWLEYINNHSDS